MVLYSRGRGRGRGGSVNFSPGNRGGKGIIGQGPRFRPVQPGLVYSTHAFPPESSFASAPNYGGPARFNFHSPRHKFGKFPGRGRKNLGERCNESLVPEIDLTKPWVTEEIRIKESQKQGVFELWKNTKSPENWNSYEVQKRTVQALYEKARVEYAASHPNEAAIWQNASSGKHHYCETCDKSFKSSDDLLLHKAEHETCGREGCEFTAHPKIIAKHIKLQHESGLFKRIGKLYTEEDISKWIEERKRRYPTRKVVEEKKILEQEKQNRGEKIKEDDSKFNKSFGNKGKGRGKKGLDKRHSKNTRNRRTRKKKETSVVEMCVEEEVSSTRKGVPAFLGIKTTNEPVIPEKNDFNISDDEWENESKPLNVVKPLCNTSLGLLASLYDSDSEVKNEELEIKSGAVTVDEESGPEEISSKNPLLEQKFNEEKVLKRKSTDRKDHRERKRKNISNESNFEKRSPTLLEKLLKNEIRHERNVILQCVHYVVKNNFFKT